MLGASRPAGTTRARELRAPGRLSSSIHLEHMLVFETVVPALSPGTGIALVLARWRPGLEAAAASARAKRDQSHAKETAMKRKGTATRVFTIATMLAMFTSGTAGLLGGEPARAASEFPASRSTREAVVGASAAHPAATSASVPVLPAPGTPSATNAPRVDPATLGKLPLYFVPNRGREDSRVAYSVQGHNTQVYFGNDGVTFALSRPPQGGSGEPTASRLPVRLASTRSERPAAAERWAVKLDFLGANRVPPAGQDLTPAVVSYFTGGETGST